MCCALDGSSPQLDTPPSGRKRRHKRHRRHAQRGRSRLVLDPVRASRLRMLIERCVLAGLDFHGLGQPTSPVEILLLAGPGRGEAPIALARQVAMYLAHVACALTLTEAARIYGRDRSTAAHACGVVEERRDNPRFDHIIELLERCVQLGLTQIEPALAIARLDVRGGAPFD